MADGNDILEFGFEDTVEVLRGADGDNGVGVCQEGEDADSGWGGCSLVRFSFPLTCPHGFQCWVDGEGAGETELTRSNSRIERAQPCWRWIRGSALG